MEGNGQEISRRTVLTAAGLAAVAGAPPGTREGPAPAATPTGGAAAPPRAPGEAGARPAPAAKQGAVSWLAATAVSRPRLRIGKMDSGYGQEVAAEERAYTEALSGQTVFTYHAHLDNLQPDTQYVYEVLNDGAAPVGGTFRTGPAGRSRGFRFTSFGDQAVPMKIGAGAGPGGGEAGRHRPAGWGPPP